MITKLNHIPAGESCYTSPLCEILEVSYTSVLCDSLVSETEDFGVEDFEM